VAVAVLVVGLDVGRVRVRSGLSPLPKETEWAVCLAESLSPRLRERKEDLGVVLTWSRREFVVEVRESTGDVVSFLGEVGLLMAGAAMPLLLCLLLFLLLMFSLVPC
jgi:hypothetical protein